MFFCFISSKFQRGFVVFGSGLMALRALVVVAFAGLLAGCSPDYNWREVTLADGLVMAAFPDKPRVQKKTLPFEGHALEFSLTGTVLNDAVFAVGHAPLPPAIGQDADLRERLYQQTLLSFYGNFGIQPPNPLPRPGQQFDIAGQGPGGPLRLQGVVWVHASSITEALVTAPADRFPTEPATQFLNAVKAPGR